MRRRKKSVPRPPGYFEALGSAVDPRTTGTRRPRAPARPAPTPGRAGLDRGRFAEVIRIDADGTVPLSDAEIDDPSLRDLPY